jgi:hypothetical protein
MRQLLAVHNLPNVIFYIQSLPTIENQWHRDLLPIPGNDQTLCQGTNTLTLLDNFAHGQCRHLLCFDCSKQKNHWLLQILVKNHLYFYV